MIKRLVYILTLITLTIWISIFSIDNRLHIIACNVGQGDSILIQKENLQILIDGGPDDSVLNCLGKHMPLLDRKIEMIILTHPQEDHYGGLVNVFKNYKVEKFGEYNDKSSSKGYKVLKSLVGSNGSRVVRLTKGITLMGGLIRLDILNPVDGDFNKNVNDDGVVSLLSFKDFKAIFMADVENKVSDKLSENGILKDVEYIKVNHHGSKNGLTEKLLNTLNPKVAVISVGFKNRYGHPDAEIVNMLKNKKIEILRTDEVGDVDYIVKN